jgi:hypothetical protein
MLVVKEDGSTYRPITQEEHEFVQGWQPTTAATVKDCAESVRVGRAIRAAMKQCWFNARKAILKLDDYANDSYMEGWAVIGQMPIEHGWVVRNGVIIDPTLPHREGVYFPGLEFRGRLGIEEFLMTPQGKKCKKEPFFFAFGWGGMDSPSFRRCYEAALATIGSWRCAAGAGVGGSGSNAQDEMVRSLRPVASGLPGLP